MITRTRKTSKTQKKGEEGHQKSKSQEFYEMNIQGLSTNSNCVYEHHVLI